MVVDLSNVDNNLIDIRTSYEFSKYNIKNSINIPKLKLLSNPSDYLNKQNKYYLICSRGMDSLYTCKILNSLGYKCFSVDGGIKKYIKS